LEGPQFVNSPFDTQETLQVPRITAVLLSLVALVVAGCGSSSSSTTGSSATATATQTPRAAFIAPLTAANTLGSTVPGNGDVNPYGLVLVPSSVGKLSAGDLLVSNFNDKENNQGTGTTIDQLTTAGKSTLFATINAKALPGSCPGGVGLTTALNVLPGGYVVVGSLPTTNGKSATAQYGCLIVLDSNGHVVKTIAGADIEGPWDSTAVSEGSKTTLFVSNALNGGAAKGIHTIDNSNVVRIVLESGEGQPPKVVSEQVIANGIPWRDSPEALVVGPTGVGLASDGTLYVADTLANRITAIPQALTRTTPAPAGGTTVTEGGNLKEPLGLVVAPNGDIITTNAGDGNIVETNPDGKQVGVQTADTKTGAGSLFGLVVAPSGNGIYYVDDGENTLRLLH
jgi:sugar lactone lactonase YvrE